MIKNIPPKIGEYGYWNKDSMQYKNKNISKWLVYTKKKDMVVYGHRLLKLN